MNKAVKFVKDCGVFYLATEDNGEPHVRPFGAITEYEGRVYITTGSPKNVFKQMIKNPKVEISATAADGSWIRLAGEASVDSNVAAKAAVKAEYPEIENIYKGRENEFMVLYLKNAIAKIYSNGQEEVIEI